MRGTFQGIFLAAAMTSGAFAQSYLGGVRGLVQDPGKASVATAKVTLTKLRRVGAIAFLLICTRFSTDSARARVVPGAVA